MAMESTYNVGSDKIVEEESETASVKPVVLGDGSDASIDDAIFEGREEAADDAIGKGCEEAKIVGELADALEAEWDDAFDDLMEAELDSLDEAESVRRLVEDALKYMSFRAVRLKFLFLRFIKDGTDDAVEEALEDE